MSKRRLALLLVLCLAGCGRRTPETEEIIEGPAVDIEKELKPGMAPEAVARLLGRPDKDEMPTSYDPQVIREFNYDNIGLHLRFHVTKGLGYAEIGRRWVRAVYGYRYGDVLKVGDVDFEKSVVLSHFKTPDWPDTYFLYDKTEVEQDGRKQTVAKVRSIVLRDETIYGSWMSTFKFNK